MAAEESIKVAVRLRPFLHNIKGEADGNTKKIIRMDELSQSVSITNPDNPMDSQKFTFDSVLWSFDGYSEQGDGYLAQDNKSVSEELYCDQKQVYEDIGKEMVQNLWNGCNSTIFTFGDSRSGKSWTLFGLGFNKGILPQAFADLFKGIRDKEKTQQQTGSSIEVRLNMAEVYNERVKDLLPGGQGSSTKFKNNVKIRENSRKGYYVEGLRTVVVVNHEDIQQRLEEGLLNRAIFLTNVNGTSANSMTAVNLSLVQKIRNHRGDEVTRVATLECFDLPACELTAYTDDGNFIGVQRGLKNNGIDNLSKCVDMLLEASIGKLTENVPVYNHSITKLLWNALSGNSKSCMVVTLSPADVCYKSSLFALQLAEKVRMLTTHSVINEEITSKLVRELKAENDKLRKLISLGEFESSDFSNRLGQLTLTSSERDSIKRKIGENMKAQIRENDKEIKSLQQSVEERLKPFKTDKNDLGKKLESERKTKNHIFNLSKDSQISSRLIHIIPLGTIDFGLGGNNKGKENNHFITFCGPGIREHHGTFTYNSKDGKISIKPSGPNCRLLVNENLIQFDTILSNNDRIAVGGNQIWIYQNPKETWLEKYAFAYKLHYEYVMEEITLKSDAYRSLNLDDSSGDLQHKLVNLIPAIEDAKSISEDLCQNFTFQPLVLRPVEALFRDSASDSDTSKFGYSDVIQDNDRKSSEEILVKVQNSVDGTFYYWSCDKFYERLEMLKDAYMQFLDDGDAPLKELEAFKERLDLDMPIGYSILCMKPLAYMINVENTIPILDHVSFQQIGIVNVSLIICDDTGEKINDVEVFVQNPDELIDENLTVNLSIRVPERIGFHYKEIYCKYKFLEEEEIISAKFDSKLPNFMGSSNKHETKFMIGPITDNTLNLILTQFLVLQFFGKQRAHKLLNLTAGSLKIQNSHGSGQLNCNHVEMERTMAQLKIKEKAEERHQRRLNALKALVNQSESLGEDSISVTMVKSLFEAKSQKHVDRSLEEHKEQLTAVPEAPQKKELSPELKALKRFSEVCSIS